MSKKDTKLEITKKIEENTEKQIKEIIADQKKSIKAIKEETDSKLDKIAKTIIEDAKTKAESEVLKEKAKHELDLKLQITKYRDSLVNDFIETAKTKIKELTGSNQYKDSLENLTFEAALTLKQPEMVIYCREEDKGYLSSQFLDKVSKLLKEKGLETKLILAKKFIKSMGGIKVETPDGKISIDNTYEKRIERSLEELKRELSALLIQEG